MASAEREPITGVWGQSPQRGPGAEPLVFRVFSFRGRSPLKKAANLPPCLYFAMSVHYTTVVCDVCVLIYKHQILTVCLFA